jgi:hypothetical protein
MSRTHQDSIAPEASELKRLRNLLEHRCLVLREMDFGDPMGVVETASIDEFEASTKHKGVSRRTRGYHPSRANGYLT